MDHIPGSRHDPLSAPLDEFIEHDTDVIEHESADVEAEELGRVVDAEFEPEVRLRRMLQTGIFYLAGDLIWVICQWIRRLKPRNKKGRNIPSICTASQSFTSAAM